MSFDSVKLQNKACYSSTWWCSGTKPSSRSLQGPAAVILTGSGMWNQGATVWRNVVCFFVLAVVISVVISCSGNFPVGWVWVEGQGYSHPQICDASHHWIVTLSDPCILTEECANDEDRLWRSVDLAHAQKHPCSLTHAPTKQADPPLPHLYAQTQGQSSRPAKSTSHLAQFLPQHSEHRTIKADGVELSWGVWFCSFLFLPSRSYSASLSMFHASETLHLLSRHAVEKREKGEHWEQALHVYWSISASLWVVAVGGRREEREATETGTLWYQTAGGEGLMA